jgi:uncharacterized protein YuzE
MIAKSSAGVRTYGGAIKLESGKYAAGSRLVKAECVVDRDDYGEVMGIEVLDVGLAAGFPGNLQVPECSLEPVAKVAYDAEADALYVRLRDGRSVRQDVATLAMSISCEGELLGLELDFGSTPSEG